MNCPDCGREVLGLACEPCTNLRFHQEIRKAQHYFIRDVRKDRARFFATRRGIPNSKGELTRWHLMLFGDRTHSFCGEEILHPVYSNRTHLAWHYIKDRSGEICDKCLSHLHKLEEQAAIKEES